MPSGLSWLVQRLRLRQTASCHEGRQLRTRGEAELLEDLGQVVRHGLRAEEESCCDLPVGRTFRNQRGDPYLLGRQSLGSDR